MSIFTYNQLNKNKMAKNVYVLIHSHGDGVDVEVFKNDEDAEESLKELAGDDYDENNDICDIGGDGCAWIEQHGIKKNRFINASTNK